MAMAVDAGWAGAFLSVSLSLLSPPKLLSSTTRTTYNLIFICLSVNRFYWTAWTYCRISTDRDPCLRSGCFSVSFSHFEPFCSPLQ